MLTLLVLAPLLLQAPSSGPAAGRFTDLSESGAVLRFEHEAAGRVRVVLRADPRTEATAFSARGRLGESLQIRFPELGAGWSARAWTGPGAWRDLPAASDGEGLALQLDFLAERELVELQPPAGALAPVGSYDYARYQAYVAGLPPDPRLQVSVLGSSVQGRPLHRIVFDDTGSKAPPTWKRTMVVLVRQHGDEWASSYVLEGMVDFLLGRRSRSPRPEITRYTRWVFYPLINPDGAVFDQRWNANGQDLNRVWGAAGPYAGQEPEIFLVQGDLAGLPWAAAVRSAGDHHGWSRGTDGGYHNSDGGGPVGASHAAYLEGLADVGHYTAYEPLVFDWSTNGGQNGMSRVELYHWRDWVVHTPEYDGGQRDDEQLRRTGERYIDAMYDALHGVAFVDAAGSPTVKVKLGARVHPEVDDVDENEDPRRAETLLLELFDLRNGDLEVVTLVETGADTGLFRTAAGVPTSGGAPSVQDGILQTSVNSWVIARYTDDDRALDQSYSGVRVRP